MHRDDNLDRDPVFWLLVVSLVPFIVAVEILCRVSDLCDRRAS